MDLVKLADWISEHWFSAHRAAVKVGPYYLLFDNGGLGDRRVTAELAFVLRQVRAGGHQAVGFETDSEFFSWVLVVRPGRPTSETKLTEMMFDCWMEAVNENKPASTTDGLYKAIQMSVAIETVAEKPLPKSIVSWLKRAAFPRPKVATSPSK